MEVGGQRHAPAALLPGMTRYLLYRRLGGPQGRSGRVWKISPPTGIWSPDRPARSESLCQLSYPGSTFHLHTIIFLLCVKGLDNFLTPHSADFWSKRPSIYQMICRILCILPQPQESLLCFLCIHPKHSHLLYFRSILITSLTNHVPSKWGVAFIFSD